MPYKALLFIILSLVYFFTSSAQQYNIAMLDSGRNISLRGLSVFNDQVFWASGSNGTVARSLNGGKTIDWLTVKEYEKTDFRDIEAFDSNTAVIMGITLPAVMLKTTDGGKNWNKIFEDTAKDMFLDAMDFKDNDGVVIGDPIHHKAFMAFTGDQGNTWKINKSATELFEGEAMFAASGTNIYLFKNKGVSQYAFITGGLRSRFFTNDTSIDLSLLQGKETTGANSLAVWQNKKYIIVGGDFGSAADTAGNCLVSQDGGKSWTRPNSSPYGYRSCAAFTDADTAVTCGITGTDISYDNGINWNPLSKTGFNVCKKAKNGMAFFFAGSNGKIAVLVKK